MDQLIREAGRLSESGLHTEAEAMIRNALILNSDNRDLLKALLRVLVEASRYEKIHEVTNKLKELESIKNSESEKPTLKFDNQSAEPIAKSVNLQNELDLDFKYAESVEQKELRLTLTTEPEELADLESISSNADESEKPVVQRPIDVSSLAESVASYYDEDEDDGEILDDENEQSEPLSRREKLRKLLDEPKVDTDLVSSLDEEYALELAEEQRGRKELSAIPNRETREGRALQVASELCFEFDLDNDYCDLLASIFLHYGWSTTKSRLRDLLEQDIELKELALAFEIRQLWASNIVFHECITYDGRDQRYVAFPWRLAVEFVRIYHSYPQIEEIEGYLEDVYSEWDRRPSLHRKFSSFYALIKDIVEDCDGPEPPAITDYMR